MSTVDMILRNGIVRCDRIVTGFADLAPFLGPVLPTKDDDLSRLPVVERIASIALLKRYEQLQDIVGRLFRAHLSRKLEDVQAMTRRDQANQMEKAGLVADDRIDFSNLRNRVVQEYPINEVEQVDRVNESWATARRLIAVYAALKARLAIRGFEL